MLIQGPPGGFSAGKCERCFALEAGATVSAGAPEGANMVPAKLTPSGQGAPRAEMRDAGPQTVLVSALHNRVRTGFRPQAAAGRSGRAPGRCACRGP